MVCSSHFKAKYVRFLIKYHLFILFCTFLLTSLSVGFLVFKRHRLNAEHLLQGFQAHGTQLSDQYRKLIALIRETQITHLYQLSAPNKIFQQRPYSSFNPHINPCSKRFYLPQCPILPYAELTFEFSNNHSKLFDSLEIFKSVCKLEWSLRSLYTNCSTNASCCHSIGPVSLLVNEPFVASEQCDNITANDLDGYHREWLSCQSSCSNAKLEKYFTYLNSPLRFQIYLAIEKNPSKLIDLYDNIHNYKYGEIFSLKFLQFDIDDEEVLLNYLLQRNRYFIYFSMALYVVCLFLFVKNIFFILIIFLHLLLTISSCLIIYFYLFHFPITILNYTSLTLYLFLLLIDSFLWYTCWYINNHRRDDCTVQRIVENLLTQTFFYIMPKNLTTIIALVITYTNQIIAIQCLTVFSFLLIFISFFISFTIYPASFIFILRYQASIPSIEQFSFPSLTNTTRCFIDRLVPYLIIRLKALWLTLLTVISCFAFAIIFQWPKLQFDTCRLTFETLPFHFSSHASGKAIKSLDIDITYYLGPPWIMPNEPFIPSEDIPMLQYNMETRPTPLSDAIPTFAETLQSNLSKMIQFCSMVHEKTNKKQLRYKHYYRHIPSSMSQNNSIINTSNGSIPEQRLSINSFSCFGDLSLVRSSLSLSTDTKLYPLILSSNNRSIDLTSVCSSNTTVNQQECVETLNSRYYSSNQNDDLFLIKNGLRFLNGNLNPLYLFQTVNYRWLWKGDLNDYSEWKLLVEHVKNSFITKFYSNHFPKMDVFWTSEIFSSLAIMERLQQEKYILIAIKFLIILVFLILLTGVLGIFVTLTTLLNFVTCIATLTLINYRLTVENASYFVIVFIICSQYSVLYSISYKLAPTFFFQRENRTMYSLKQLFTTLSQLTFSILLICTPCLFSSVPYLFKSATVYIIASSISLIYSTFFLQSLLCFVGPADQVCLLIPWRLTFTRNLNSPANKTNKSDMSLRNASTSSARRQHRHFSHHRVSTSSHFASSYFSQIFTGSTYCESEYGGLNESLTMASRRRESSRSHQASHTIKRGSFITGELIELYTPRASLAPHAHHLHHNRYSRQSSVTRGIPSTTPAKPLYISPSISPYSQLSIHSQIPSRQRSPSPHIFRPSRSPSPRSFMPVTTAGSLRPCYSAPRLHVPIRRGQTVSVRHDKTLFEETQIPSVSSTKKSVMIVQRQDAVSSIDNIEQSSTRTTSPLSAATKRSMLKATTVETGGDPVWLKRSNSS